MRGSHASVPLPSGAQLFLQQFIQQRRIGLAAGGAHHLPNEPAERLRLRLHLLDLLWARRDDLINDLLDNGADRQGRYSEEFCTDQEAV